jgi:hypothetical protein
MENLPGITTRGICHRNGYSAMNYWLIDEEYTGRIVILLGITSSGTRNPIEKLDSARINQIIDKKSTRGMRFRLG